MIVFFKPLVNAIVVEGVNTWEHTAIVSII